MQPIILIPVYNPDEKLPAALDDLREAGFRQFVLVDDGSRPECLPVFKEALGRGDCRLIRHAVNLGKGRALKTGFNYVLDAFPDAPGVITVDADGQHPPGAVLRVAAAMRRHPDALALGVRKFFRATNVPLPNMLGNTITRLAFRLLTGLSFGDTQCGLRGFPRRVMEAFLPVAGDRFDYENVMLLRVRDFRIDTVEVPMEAVYIGGNETSHFDRLADSVRIYSHLVGYAAAPLAMALASLLLFREIRTPAPGWWTPPAVWWSAAACGAATLAGWAAMLLWLPGRKRLAGLGAGLLAAALHAGLYGCLHALAGLSSAGSWWLAGLPAAYVSYSLWLRIRHGSKPRRYRED